MENANQFTMTTTQASATDGDSTSDGTTVSTAEAASRSDHIDIRAFQHKLVEMEYKLERDLLARAKAAGHNVYECVDCVEARKGLSRTRELRAIANYEVYLRNEHGITLSQLTANMEIVTLSSIRAALMPKCVICQDRKADSTVLPCGHSTSCFECYQALMREVGKTCITCNQPFEELVKQNI